MIALEMVRPGGDVPAPEAAAAVLEGTRRRGLLVGRGGLGGNVLRIAPPLSVTADEAGRAGAILVEAVEEVDAALR